VVARSTAELLSEAGLPVWYVGCDPPRSDDVRWIPSPARPFFPRPEESSRAAALRYLLNELINVGRATVWGLRNTSSIRPDVVISNHPVTTMLFRLVHSRTRILYRMHDGIHAQNGVRRFLDRAVRFLTSEVLERFSVGLASYVITPGERVRQELLAMKVPSWKVSAMYPIVDWVAGPGPLVPDPAPSGTAPSARFVLSIGQQTGRKRFDLLIEALQHLASDLNLVLVGDGPLHDRYRSRVEELGLRDRVTFVTDASDQRVQDLYRDCTMYALLSENEGFPVTVAEALASGVPTIYACPSATDSIPRPPQGLIVEGALPLPVDLARLLDGIAADIKDGILPTRERIGAWARQVLPSREGAAQTYISVFARMGVDAPATA
jgi:glycosyltransferase involved in cell wall biosynthesis